MLFKHGTGEFQLDAVIIDEQDTEGLSRLWNGIAVGKSCSCRWPVGNVSGGCRTYRIDGNVDCEDASFA